MRTRAYRFGGSIPAFPAQWLYGLLRALPGRAGLVVTVAHEKLSLLSDLTPASGRQDHTTSPYASGMYVYTPSASIASHRAFVTFASAPHPAARRAELCR
jgi:hypothetical protein